MAPSIQTILGAESAKRFTVKCDSKTFLPYGTKMVKQPSGKWREAEPGEQYHGTLAQDVVIDEQPQMVPIRPAWNDKPVDIRKAVEEVNRQAMLNTGLMFTESELEQIREANERMAALYERLETPPENHAFCRCELPSPPADAISDAIAFGNQLAEEFWTKLHPEDKPPPAVEPKPETWRTRDPLF